MGLTLANDGAYGKLSAKDLLETLELQNIMDNALVTMYVPRSDPLLQTRLVPDTCAAFARQCVLPVLEAGVKAACGGT